MGATGQSLVLVTSVLCAMILTCASRVNHAVAIQLNTRCLNSEDLKQKATNLKQCIMEFIVMAAIKILYLEYVTNAPCVLTTICARLAKQKEFTTIDIL